MFESHVVTSVDRTSFDFQFEDFLEQSSFVNIHLLCNSPGGEVLKILSVGHCLNLISRIQEITLARNFCSFSSEALQ